MPDGPRVICVSNQKGGVGKTTTAVCLAAELRARGRSTALVDLDPQGHATHQLGLDEGEHFTKSAYDVFCKDVPLEQAVVGAFGLDAVPGSIAQAICDVELAGVPGRELLLRERIGEAGGAWDWVVLDCPPTLNVLTTNALTAATAVVIPCQPQALSLVGFEHLLQTVDVVRRRLNPALRVAGILVTQYDRRLGVQRQAVDFLREELGRRYPVFATTIPQSVRVQEASAQRRPLASLYPDSPPAAAYAAFVDELLAGEGGRARP